MNKIISPRIICVLICVCVCLFVLYPFTVDRLLAVDSADRNNDSQDLGLLGMVLNQLRTPVATSIGWSIVFLIITLCFNKFVAGTSRGSDRVFAIEYFDKSEIKNSNNQGRFAIFKRSILYHPLPHTKNAYISELKHRLDEIPQYYNVVELAPGWLETSVAIDLCVGAMLTTLTTGISKQNANSFILFSTQFIILFFCSYLLKANIGSQDRFDRVVYAIFTNVVGFATLVLSFMLLNSSGN